MILSFEFLNNIGYIEQNFILDFKEKLKDN